MAKNSPQSTNSAETESFNKGLLKDYDDAFYPEGTWSHARNAINNTVGGGVGLIGNEPANIKCTQAPYTVIGAINLQGDQWVVYSTDDINSEIGFFEEGTCTYSKIVNASCLNFNRTHIITGISKQNFDCSWQVYWADGLNPDRTLNVGDIRNAPYNDPWPGVPYVCELPLIKSTCQECEFIQPYQLDCEQLRLSRLMNIPSVSAEKGAAGGTLLNGSYYALVAYSINGQRVTDYFPPSNIQPLFDYQNESCSLLIKVSNLETTTFEEFELVVVTITNQQAVAKKIGYYNTQGNAVEIFLDNINLALESVPLKFIPLVTPVYEKSDAIYRNGEYAIRVAPYSRLDFNYQPLANQIDTEWVMVEQRPDYYRRGGSDTGYMRDEQYAFFIRWVYDTGDRSSSYHIPGRPAELNREIQPNGQWLATPNLNTNDNVDLAASNFDGGPYTAPKIWEMINTAYVTSPTSLLNNGTVIPGKVVAYGKMGYWESTELYPSNKPDIWNASSHPWSASGNSNHDLCGKPIRHHKMPADILNTTRINDGDPINYSRVRTKGGRNNPDAIRILGVRFNNIKAPVDNNGNVIPGIVGYEILRSSRQGNRTVIAKGIINNMRAYETPEEEQILYQNYPYNSLQPDPSLTTIAWNADMTFDSEDNKWNQPLYFAREYSRSYFTFHSPDTSFTRPFLAAEELRLYGEVGSTSNVRGNFQEVEGHPKEKLPTDLSFMIALCIGMGSAALAVRGKETKVINTSSMFNSGQNISGVPAAISSPLIAQVATALSQVQNITENTVGNVGGTAVGLDISNMLLSGLLTLNDTLNMTIAGGQGYTQDFSYEQSEFGMMPPIVKAFGGLVTYTYYMTQGTDAALDLIRSTMKYRQFATSYISHGNLHQHNQGNARLSLANTRRYLKDAVYLSDQLQEFDEKRINNAYRNKTVALSLRSISTANPRAELVDPGYVTDNSTQVVSSARNNGLLPNYSNITNLWFDYNGNRGHNFDEFNTTAVSYYGGLKQRIRNQYGQLDSIIQVPTGSCHIVNNNNSITSSSFTMSSPIIYGGDIYIGRYTEKNTFFYFYDWLMNMPDGTEMDYRFKTMINNPRFWADFTKFDTNSFLQTAISNLITFDFFDVLDGLPSNQFNLDNDYFSSTNYANLFGLGNATNDTIQLIQDVLTGVATSINDVVNGIGTITQDIINIFPTNPLQTLASFVDSIRFDKKDCYMYLFQSGVRDFFVESEINVDLRDRGIQEREYHYDPYSYTNLEGLFNPLYIKEGNFYKYDLSLSNSKVFSNNTTWGYLQPRYYDPLKAETCYTYQPNRLIYSLAQQKEAIKDFWFIYLVNNYRDFTSRITGAKPINKNGITILFENDAPLMFQGVDTLQTDLGTKITLGDGGLFSQAQQSLTNADQEYQHGSCQNRNSIVNTPIGIYFMSQAQGKVFGITGKGLEEISASGMRWWFNRYLPFTILEDFPDFKLIDNTIVGVGCQTTYDNTDLLLYFCKTDYRLKAEYKGLVTYTGNDNLFNYGNITIKLGDPVYFENTSWTVSYDPKNQLWISFHDWQPELTLSSKLHFLTTKTLDGKGTIWRHNDNTQLFANYYGVDYPFEIEYIAQTGQIVNTLKSIEYDLECYTYDIDGIDTYHVLDFNFDRAVVHNTEQVSGVLNLNLQPRRDPLLELTYPKINLDSIDVLYTKVEQKYRFNQFWDITKDRGEYTYPNVQQTIWDTELNGFKRKLNPNNLNYQKLPFERKKFRHYTSHVLLYRNISGNVKMLFKLANNKNQQSPR
jgi:hypothetical protein